MRILQLCKKFPFPLKDGESIAVTNLARSYGALGVQTALLAMNTSKHYIDINGLPESFTSIYQSIRAVEVNNDIKRWGAFLNLFEKESYHVTRFISTDFEKALIELLSAGSFDVVQLETIFLAPYIKTIRKYSRALVVIRAHNVEHEIWERFAKTSANLWSRAYLRLLNPKLKRFEKERINECDLLLPITSRDLKIFRELGFHKKAAVTPVGVDERDYARQPLNIGDPLSLCFIGSLDWMPNQEGLKWFLEKVWKPYFSRNSPHKIELHIAGRNAPAWIRRLKEDHIFFYGEVKDARRFIGAHPVVVAPIFAGSGIRVKILESMALERIVVTTSLGLEGVEAKNGREVLIADTPEAFRDAILSCIAARSDVKKIGFAARQYVLQHFDSRHIAQKALAAFQSMGVVENAHANV